MHLQARLENLFRGLFPEYDLNDTEDFDIQQIQSWDSIKYIIVVLALEEEFTVKFTDDEILDLTSFNNIHKVLISKGLK
jgi:acyl carrier protein